jgi:hypothetical protein
MKPVVFLEVLNFLELINIIKPFFYKYPLLGKKQLDYLDWCKVLELMDNNVHLTTEGMDRIKEIKSIMNRDRII